MVNFSLVEQVARIIYTFGYGIQPKDYMRVRGVRQLDWEDLAEIEKNDFRLQAERVLSFLENNGHLRE